MPAGEEKKPLVAILITVTWKLFDIYAETKPPKLSVGDQWTYKSIDYGGVFERTETIDRMEDFETYQSSMKLANEVRDKFMEELKNQFGFEQKVENTLCRHIQEKIYGRPFSLIDDEDRQAFLDAGGHGETGCPKVCGIAAEVVAEKIMELGYGG